MYGVWEYNEIGGSFMRLVELEIEIEDNAHVSHWAHLGGSGVKQDSRVELFLHMVSDPSIFNAKEFNQFIREIKTWGECEEDE